MESNGAQNIEKTLTKLKGEICNSTMIVGNFKTLLWIMDNLDRKSVRKQRTTL